MELEITAKTEKGKEALKKVYKDSKAIRARLVCTSNVISEEPYTISIYYKLLKGVTNAAKDNNVIFSTLKHSMVETLKEYGITEQDYEVA